MTEWTDLLNRTAVGQLLPPNFLLHKVNSTDLVPAVLKVLAENHISSVPVMEGSRYLGMVDMLDMLLVVVMMTEAKGLADILCSREIDWNVWLKREIEVLNTQTIAELSNISERNPWRPVSSNMPVGKVGREILGLRNVHRVPVITGQEEEEVGAEKNGKILGILSQSALISFIHSNIHLCPNAGKEMKDIKKPKENQKEIVSINIKAKAIEAFKLMFSHEVSGLPVVDDEGVLVAAISASDLKGSDKDNLFADLDMPIPQYLETRIGGLGRDFGSLDPLSCTGEDKLGDVVGRLHSKHVHRIFLVDEKRKPVDIFSLGDIIVAAFES
jgi:CBS domain-containing protein